MMESSEQCAENGSLEPDNSSSTTERITITSLEDYIRENLQLNLGATGEQEFQISEQVVGYLDEENPTLDLSSCGVEINERRLLLLQSSSGKEFLAFVSTQDTSIEHSLEESNSGHSPGNHILAKECGSNSLETLTSEGTQKMQLMEANDLQNIDRKITVCVGQAHEIAYADSDNNHYSAETIGEGAVVHVQEKDDATEMVLIPPTSQVISAVDNTRLLHLADVGHSQCEMSEIHEKEEIGCDGKIKSVIAGIEDMHLE